MVWVKLNEYSWTGNCKNLNEEVCEPILINTADAHKVKKQQAENRYYVSYNNGEGVLTDKEGLKKITRLLL